VDLSGVGELGHGDGEGKGAGVGAGATVSLCSQLRGVRPTERATTRAVMVPWSLVWGAAGLGDADGKGTLPRFLSGLELTEGRPRGAKAITTAGGGGDRGVRG